MASVFISYVHEDERVAKGCPAIPEEGLQRNDRRHEVFLSSDPWHVSAGENWLDCIRDELLDAAVVVLMMSVFQNHPEIVAACARLTGRRFAPSRSIARVTSARCVPQRSPSRFSFTRISTSDVKHRRI
jgi:hypothetical protein